DGLRQARLRDQDVVPSRRNPLEPSAPELAQLPLDAVARDGIPGPPGDAQAEPGLAGILITVEPVQHEEARRGRPSLAVDGIEVSRARQAVPALHWRLGGS